MPILPEPGYTNFLSEWFVLVWNNHVVSFLHGTSVSAMEALLSTHKYCNVIYFTNGN